MLVPDSELDYWRARQRTIGMVMDTLKGSIVLGSDKREHLAHLNGELAMVNACIFRLEEYQRGRPFLGY